MLCDYFLKFFKFYHLFIEIVSLGVLHAFNPTAQCKPLIPAISRQRQVNLDQPGPQTQKASSRTPGQPWETLSQKPKEKTITKNRNRNKSKNRKKAKTETKSRKKEKEKRKGEKEKVSFKFEVYHDTISHSPFSPTTFSYTPPSLLNSMCTCMPECINCKCHMHAEGCRGEAGIVATKQELYEAVSRHTRAEN